MSDLGNYDVNRRHTFISNHDQSKEEIKSDSAQQNKNETISEMTKEVFNVKQEEDVSLNNQFSSLGFDFDINSLSPEEREEFLAQLEEYTVLGHEIDEVVQEVKEESNADALEEQIEAQKEKRVVQNSLIIKSVNQERGIEAEQQRMLDISIRKLQAGDFRSVRSVNDDGIMQPFEGKYDKNSSLVMIVDEASNQFVPLTKNVNSQHLKQINPDGTITHFIKMEIVDKDAWEEFEKALEEFFKSDTWKAFTPQEQPDTSIENLIPQSNMDQPNADDEYEPKGMPQLSTMEQITENQQYDAKIRSMEKRSDALKDMDSQRNEILKNLKQVVSCANRLKITLSSERKADQVENEKMDQNNKLLEVSLNAVPKTIEKLIFQELVQRIDILIKLVPDFALNYPEEKLNITLETLVRFKQLLSKMYVNKTGTNVGIGSRISQS